MKRFLFGLMMGIVLTLALTIPLLLYERQAKFEYGLYHGKITGKEEIAQILQNEFTAIP